MDDWGNLAVELLTADGHDTVEFVNLPGMNRLEDLKRFYSLLNVLELSNGGCRMLSNCSGRMAWPKRGVYFFFERDENRTDTGIGLRVVRVGTTTGAKSTLWNRLRGHKGTEKTGGGNHRGSVFRLLVGTALIRKNGFVSDLWGIDKTACADITKSEESLEIEVSKIIRNMPLLWLAAEDQPGKENLRGYIEKNSIALLSNLKKPTIIDAPSTHWLGFHCDCKKISGSGLWNRDHTDKNYAAAFLDDLERLIQQMQTTA